MAPFYLFFSILKLVPFKKSNGMGRIDMDVKILKTVLFTLFFYSCFFIIFNLIYFIKNTNIMNLYKLFIKNYSNNYYYYILKYKIE